MLNNDADLFAIFFTEFHRTTTNLNKKTMPVTKTNKSACFSELDYSFVMLII